jgi:hypothetical protein
LSALSSALSGVCRSCCCASSFALTVVGAVGKGSVIGPVEITPCVMSCELTCFAFGVNRCAIGRFGVNRSRG